MAEIRVNTTGTLKLFDADDSHSADIAAGTITSSGTVLTLNTNSITAGAQGTTSFLSGIAIASENNSIFMSDSDIMDTSDTAAFDTVYGWTAGNALTTGDSNTLIGYAAGTAITTGSYNIMIGESTGDGFDTETNNLGVGNGALGGSVAGAEYNVGVGNYSLLNLTSGDFNTCLGYHSGTNLSTGQQNVFIGYQAGKEATTADGCTVVGRFAGGASGTMTGNLNSFFGNSAGALMTSGNSNVAVGADCGANMASTVGATFVGFEAGRAHNYDGASYVTMVGHQAGEDQTTSAYNTGFGAFNQKSSDTETHNTSIGYYAMNGANGGGEYNTALGSYVMSDSSQSGDYNVGVGWRALYGNTSGASNNAVGYLALTACTTGALNNAFGDRALTAVVGGGYNTAFGQQAGFGITSGNNNICIGFDSGRGTSPSGNITTASNQICLGDDNISALFCADTSISSSDKRDKTDIENFTTGLSFIEKMQPVTYKWDKRSWYSDDLSATPDGSKKATKTNVGFLAQDVETLEKEIGFANNKDDMLFVSLTEDDKRYGIKYERLVTVLVNAVKELSAKVKALEEA